MGYSRWLSAFIVLTLLGLGAPRGEALADPPSGVPSANTKIQGLVPAGLAEKVARRHARDTWGQVAPGPSFVLSDEDGDIVGYAYTYAVGKSSFPAAAELSAQIRYGREIAERGFAAMNESDRKNLLSAIATKAQETASTPDRPGLPPAKKVTGADSPSGVDEHAREYGRRKTVGAGEYGTVVVSARFDRFPIPYYSNYLPPYVSNGDLAEAEAGRKLSADKVSLDRIYFIERKGMFYEFSSASGSVLLHAGSLKELPSEEVLKRKGKKVSPVPEALATITSEWNRKKQEVGE